MLRFRVGLLITCAMFCPMSGSIRADDSVATKHYGAGVHDYYAGRYFEALNHFDTAIGLSGRDARMYLFRGLTKLRLGYRYDAETDFMLGAQLEAALKRRDVGRALQRIQGPDRLTIERFRREAQQLPAELVQGVVPPREPAVVVRPAPPQRAVAPAAVVVDELPSDGTDPFREDAPGVLGQGEMEVVVDQPSGAGQVTSGTSDPAEGFDESEPFGSGVVAEAESDDDLQDPFAAQDQPPADQGQNQGGILGSAIRAFSRVIAPGAAANRETSGADPAGSGEPAADDEADPFAIQGEEDPFAAPAADDPFADPAATQPVEPQDAPADEDETDPFADDPFDFE